MTQGDDTLSTQPETEISDQAIREIYGTIKMGKSYREAMNDISQRLIDLAMAETPFITHAAKILKMNRSTLSMRLTSGAGNVYLRSAGRPPKAPEGLQSAPAEPTFQEP